MEFSAFSLAARPRSIDLGQNKNRPPGTNCIDRVHGLPFHGTVLETRRVPATSPQRGAYRVQPRDRRAGPDPALMPRRGGPLTPKAGLRRYVEREQVRTPGSIR